jgi:hypothetical protein
VEGKERYCVAKPWHNLREWREWVGDYLNKTNYNNYNNNNPPPFSPLSEIFYHAIFRCFDGTGIIPSCQGFFRVSSGLDNSEIFGKTIIPSCHTSISERGENAWEIVVVIVVVVCFI